MDSKKKTKIIKLVALGVMLILAMCFWYKSFSTFYTNVYYPVRYNGVEYHWLYIALALIFTFASVLIIASFFIDKIKKKRIRVFINCISCALLIAFSTSIMVYAVNSVDIRFYSSSKVDSKVSSYFPINKKTYSEKSEDVNRLIEINRKNFHWIGGYSQKDFAADNTLVYLTEEQIDSCITNEYCFIYDKTGKSVNKALNEVAYLSKENRSKLNEDKYFTDEDDFNYYFYYANTTEFFYMEMSKGKRNQFSASEFEKIALSLVNQLDDKETQNLKVVANDNSMNLLQWNSNNH